MKAEIINVGTELLLGDTINTNAAYLSQRLADIGVHNYHHSVVGDNPQRLQAVFETALERSELIILTGGLGPTYDDLTKEVVASCLGLTLHIDPTSRQHLESYFSNKNRKMTENNLKQAYIPTGSKAIVNDVGTAPGILIEQNNHRVILLPGPPRELKHMFEHHVIPYLTQLSDTILVSDRIYLFGIGESAVEAILEQDMKTLTNPTLAPYAKPTSLMLRITALAQTEAQGHALNAPVIEKIQSLFADYIYGVNTSTLEAAVVEALKLANLKIAIAESCSGGMMSSRLVDVPGSSAVFAFGATTYTNAMKTKVLGVPAALLERVGAVSKPVAIAMSEGVQALAQADIGVAITGLAGPDGGSDSKPIGLVYVAVSFQGQTHVKQLHLASGRTNQRQRIRELAVNHAFMSVLQCLKKK